ncbi:RTA1 like protein-domain-containing protein [Mycena rosella]|uniref:RTA1 like protein-domain-containing protein n=1 Tax=Mycena rosella TaxID=1033263 RepID=A0AAD7GZP7_MYCRO|nr:RTA1 like protein-domain-containing protein [Mycena rosella]
MTLLNSTGLDPIAADNYLYGYVPQESVAIMFLILFAVATIAHIGQATYYKAWWLLPTAAACGIGEIIGWSGRLWSSISPTLNTPYLIQISTTALSPTPLLAANFMILSRIVQVLGTAYAWITPTWFTLIFLPCDLIALVVQGVGGGLASSATDLAGANKLESASNSAIVIILLSTAGLDFFRRYISARPARNTAVDSATRGVLTLRLKIMLSTLAFSTTALFIRSIYRIIELSTGWTGRIIQT